MVYTCDAAGVWGMVRPGPAVSGLTVTRLLALLVCGLLRAAGAAPRGVTMDLQGVALVKMSYYARDGEQLREVRGFYSVVGTVGHAHGNPQQIHPLSCDALVDDDVRRPWVAVIFLEEPNITANSECGQVYNLTHRAALEGASAVILDIRHNRVAASQLSGSSLRPLSIPVILVEGDQSLRLRQIVADSDLRTATLYVSQDRLVQSQQGSTKLMVIVAMVMFVIIVCVVSGILIRMKCYQGSRQPSMSDVAKGILSKMGTRKFVLAAALAGDGEIDTCAVCLEDYRDGQEVRTVACGHEFHKVCVDPWLIANRTCPLCMYNITDRGNDSEGSLCSTPNPRLHTSTLLPPSGGPVAPSLATPSNHHNYYSPLSNGYNHVYAGAVPGPYSSPYHPVYSPAVDHRVRGPIGVLQNVPPVYRDLYSTSPVHTAPDYNFFGYNNALPLLATQKEPLLRRPTSPPGLPRTLASVQTKAPGPRTVCRRRPPGRHKALSQRARTLSPERRASSSESDQEVRGPRSRTRVARYASSQCDADVSELSTGESERTSHHDLVSTRSVFGSSDVPTDLSSCEGGHVYSQGARQLPEEGERRAVHLQPACMSVTPHRKPASPRKHRPGPAKPAPYSVIPPSRRRQTQPHPPGSLDDSDHTLSSLDTASLSPHISGWSHSSDSDNVLAPSHRQAALCPMCQGGATYTKHRSEPAARPLLDAFSSPYVVSGGPRTTHKIYPPHSLTLGQTLPPWERGQNSADHSVTAGQSVVTSGQPVVTDTQYSHGSVSKAGSTCSFYCYPSNQHSSSASSSPLHHHREGRHSNHAGLVVQTGPTGDVSTSSLGYPHLLPGNVV